ncbi:MAG: hypothetical protein ACYDB7_00055 [Mycobacteriales bacterium]
MLPLSATLLSPTLLSSVLVRTAALVPTAVLPPLPPLPGVPTLPGLPGGGSLGGGAGSGLGGVVGTGIASALTSGLAAVCAAFLAVLADPIARFVLHTPDLAAEPTLRAVWETGLAIQAVLLTLVLAIAGIALIPGPTTRIGTAAREVVSTRLVAGVVTAAVALPLVAAEAELANRVVDALLPASAPGGALFAAVGTALRAGGTGQLALLVVATVQVVLLVGLALGGLARFAVVWVAVALAPLAMTAGALPGGAGLVRAWWRLQVAAVLLPIGEAGVLLAYAAMTSSARTGLVGALAGVAVTAVMAKLPGWAAGAATGVGAGEVGSRVARTHGHARRAVLAASTPATGTAGWAAGRTAQTGSGLPHGGPAPPG